MLKSHSARHRESVTLYTIFASGSGLSQPVRLWARPFELACDEGPACRPGCLRVLSLTSYDHDNQETYAPVFIVHKVAQSVERRGRLIAIAQARSPGAKQRRCIPA